MIKQSIFSVLLLLVLLGVRSYAQYVHSELDDDDVFVTFYEDTPAEESEMIRYELEEEGEFDMEFYEDPDEPYAQALNIIMSKPTEDSKFRVGFHVLSGAENVRDMRIRYGASDAQCRFQLAEEGLERGQLERGPLERGAQYGSELLNWDSPVTGPVNNVNYIVCAAALFDDDEPLLEFPFTTEPSS